MLELFLLVLLSKIIGFGNVFFFLVAKFIVGLIVIKRQNSDQMDIIRKAMQSGDPIKAQKELGAQVSGMMAGFLMMAPGVFTTIFSVLLLIPKTREFVFKKLVSRAKANNASSFGFHSEPSDSQSEIKRPRTFEGEYERHDINDEKF